MMAIYKKFQQKNIVWPVIGIVLLATAGRLLLIINNWPITNSDEATMALMAKHISQQREWPVMFYGQGYMGAIEAYLAAPFFLLTGPSLASLRIGLLLFYACFVIAMYCHTRFLYSQKFALFICLLLCLGSKEIITRQLKAIGGYPELPLLAILICMLAVKILWSGNEMNLRQRRFLYCLLGLLSGFSLWVDFLILPFVCTGLLLMLLLAKKDVLSSPGLWLLAGFVIGISPVIMHNLVAPFDQSTFANMAGFVNASDGKSYTLLHKIAGTFFISIPVATGYPRVCSADALPILGTMNTTCTILQSAWSLGYLLLWTLACWKSGKNILQARRQPERTSREWRQQQILEYSRLMILLSCGITILTYTLSMAAASAPLLAARYLVCLLLSIPVILWQLWPHKSSTLKLQFRSIRGSMNILSRLCLLLLILSMFVSGIVEAFADITTAQQFSVHQANLIQRLQTLKATHIYSEYWTCNRLIFQSNEKIMCSVLNEDLTPGMNRYPPYHLEVKKAPKPAYIFPYRSQHDLNFIKKQTQTNQLQNYRYIKYENYSLYVPY